MRSKILEDRALEFREKAGLLHNPEDEKMKTNIGSLAYVNSPKNNSLKNLTKNRRQSLKNDLINNEKINHKDTRKRLDSKEGAMLR